MAQNNQNKKQQNQQKTGQNNSRYSFPDERERRDGPGGEDGGKSCNCVGECKCGS